MTDKDDHEHKEGTRRIARTDVEIDLRDGMATRVVRRGAWPTTPAGQSRASASSASRPDDADEKATAGATAPSTGRVTGAADALPPRSAKQPTPFLRPLRTVTAELPVGPTVLEDDFDEIDLTDSARPLPHWTTPPAAGTSRVASQARGKDGHGSEEAMSGRAASAQGQTARSTDGNAARRVEPGTTPKPASPNPSGGLTARDAGVDAGHDAVRDAGDDAKGMTAGDVAGKTTRSAAASGSQSSGDKRPEEKQAKDKRSAMPSMPAAPTVSPTAADSASTKPTAAKRSPAPASVESTTSPSTSPNTTPSGDSSAASSSPQAAHEEQDGSAFRRFRRSAKIQGIDPAAAPSAEQFQKSSLATRVVTGLLAAAIAVVAFANGPTWLMGIVFVVAFGAAVEFYDATRSAGFRPATALGILGVLGVVGGAWARGEIAIPAVLSLTLFFGFLWFILGIGKASPTANLGVTLLGVVWVGVLTSFGALLLRAPDNRGVAFLGAAALLVVTYDTIAYLVGSAVGKRKLAPKISPSKTVEGLLGATVATLLMGLVVLPFVHPWGVFDGLVLAAVLCVVAPLGDLAESIVKRDLGVKDMGRILPGHGGILDRFDAILLALPVTYYVVIILGLWSA